MIKNKRDKNLESNRPSPKKTKKKSLIGPVFVDATCDVGFKKIMSDSDVLIDFLNTFLPDETPKIVSAKLLPEEHLGRRLKDKRIYFDIRAKDEQGEIYIIEVQRRSQDFFINRSLYYNSREIANQGQAGSFKTYKLKPVYSISVLNYIPDAPWAKSYYNIFTLRRKGTFEELTQQTMQIIIILPKMELSAEKLHDRRTKWCYLLRYAVKLRKAQIAKLKWTDEAIFERIKEILHIATFTPKEIRMLDEAQKIEWDYEAMQDYIRRTATAEGHAKGLAKGLAKGEQKTSLTIAKKLLKSGIDIKTIATCVNMTQKKVKELKAAMKLK